MRPLRRARRRLQNDDVFPGISLSSASSTTRITRRDTHRSQIACTIRSTTGSSKCDRSIRSNGTNGITVHVYLPCTFICAPDTSSRLHPPESSLWITLESIPSNVHKRRKWESEPQWYQHAILRAAATTSCAARRRGGCWGSHPGKYWAQWTRGS